MYEDLGSIPSTAKKKKPGVFDLVKEALLIWPPLTGRFRVHQKRKKKRERKKKSKHACQLSDWKHFFLECLSGRSVLRQIAQLFVC
jgi:hypothetical protein